MGGGNDCRGGIGEGGAVPVGEQLITVSKSTPL